MLRADDPSLLPLVHDRYSIENGRAPSILRLGIEEVGGRFDHPFAMLEQPLTVTTNKVDLMLAAFLTHRLQVLDRMRAGHFRGKFAKQVRLGSDAIEYFAAGEDHVFQHRLLCADREIHSALVRLG